MKDITVIGTECKFATHIPKTNRNRDAHLIKERIHYSDGSTKPNLKIIYDFKRPYYITKEHYRNHKQKKENEDLDKVNRFYSTQSDLANNIAIKIGKVGYRSNNMRDVVDTPYLYGCNISSTAIIKEIYKDKYPDLNTPYNVATLDIENDVDTGEITIITVATNDNIHTVINESFVSNISNVKRKLKELYDKHIPNTKLKEHVTITNVIKENEIELIKEAFRIVHEWQPDFLAVWNINYDIPKITETIINNGLDPKDIYSDPNIPKELRYYKYVEGAKQLVTEAGKVVPKGIQDQWHYAITASTFTMIDAMTSYNFIRVGAAAIPGGYGLDNVLKINVNLGKLKFDDIPKYKGADWHRHMSNNKPLEYIIYNQWDCMSMLELDNKTTDLAVSLPLLSGISDFSIFNSGPKKIVDGLHFFYLKNKKVIGTKPSRVVNDKYLGLGGWIITLKAFMNIGKGLKVTQEDRDFETNTRALVYDIDAVSSYPSDGRAANISTDTTEKELLGIEGYSLDEFRHNNIDLFTGGVNAVTYAVNMYKLPDMNQMLEEIKKDM